MDVPLPSFPALTGKIHSILIQLGFFGDFPFIIETFFFSLFVSSVAPLFLLMSNGQEWKVHQVHRLIQSLTPAPADCAPKFQLSQSVSSLLVGAKKRGVLRPACFISVTRRYAIPLQTSTFEFG